MRLRAVSALAGLVVATAPAALAQNPTIVLGESLARTCYENAAGGQFTMQALEDCDRVFNTTDVSGHDRAATYTNRAVIRQGRGDIEGAIADLTAAIRLGPPLAVPHLNLGGIYALRGQWADARAEIDQGVALDPTAARANDYFTRAAAREELGDIPGAYADYQKAAELAPEWDMPRQELSRFRVEPATSVDNGAS